MCLKPYGGNAWIPFLSSLGAGAARPRAQRAARRAHAETRGGEHARGPGIPFVRPIEDNEMGCFFTTDSSTEIIFSAKFQHLRPN